MLRGRVPGPGRARVGPVGGDRAPVAAEGGRAARVRDPGRVRRRYSHVRLRIYPDGGVARLRVHGVVVPDPALLEGLTFDLAALENGGDVVACSDRFYSSPRNAISPGLSRVMGEGWETRRRRSAGNEWLAVRFAGAGDGVAGRDGHLRVHRELARHGGGARVRGQRSARAWLMGARLGHPSWAPLLPRTPLLPDTPHRFRVRRRPRSRPGAARRASPTAAWPGCGCTGR